MKGFFFNLISPHMPYFNGSVPQGQAERSRIPVGYISLLFSRN